MSESKSETLYVKLRSDLVQGLFRPGSRISEAELSREYGVSRSPIREAVVRLEADGLLVRSGMVISVRQRTDEEIIDIYRVRVQLEAEIAADAARRRTEVDLMNLQVAIEAEAGIDRQDPLSVVRANRRFHESLANASHNDTLKELQSRLTGQIAMLPATTLSAPGRWEEAHAQHCQIAEAVLNRETDLAASVAQLHMTVAKDLRLKHVVEHSVPAEG